jgi:glucan 1,3-beta-glucosidase
LVKNWADSNSGRQGIVGWINGPNGAQNANYTTEFLIQLATFFNQTRYTNLVTLVRHFIYQTVNQKFSLLNEPNELVISPQAVTTWTQKTYEAMRGTGYSGYIIISDGILPTNQFVGLYPSSTYSGYYLLP